MDNRQVFLTADSDGQGWAFAKPRVVAVPESTIINVVPNKVSTGLTAVKTREAFPASAVGKTYKVYESAQQVEAARNPSSTDVYVKAVVKTALSGAGTVQGDGTIMTGYINEFTTVGSGTASVLPAATVGAVAIVMNNGANTLKVFPATGEFIDAALVNVNTTVVVAKRKTFVCKVAGTWITADDYTQ